MNEFYNPLISEKPTEEEIKSKWASKKERVLARANYTIELNNKTKALANEASKIKTLRDEIAIAAMQSFLITDKEREFEDIADFSYRMADEMLVAKRFIERDEHK